VNILIIGGGNMGTTYARSFLRAHITTPEQMMILERSEEKAKALRQQDLGTIFTDHKNCMPQADLIVLAVKPQDAPALFDTLRPHIDPQQVFLSIMAGLTIEGIQQGLGVKKVIRAMPNLPAQIGMGMTAYTSSEEVTRIELVMVQNLLNTTGKSIYVEKEHLLDAATAISGSGPAYVWYFMQSLIRSAEAMGFSQSEAELLVSQTFRGAIELHNKQDLSCTEWIERVCSRGGTTEAALAVYRDKEVELDIQAGAEAALHRAEELGGK
jgi:pyrroline-5-carboxylate reductase